MTERRQLNRTPASADQQQTQRSPAPALSRTPTADRQLLRALTGTPEDTDLIYDDETPEPTSTHIKAPHYPQPQTREPESNNNSRLEPEASRDSRHRKQRSRTYDDSNSASRTPQAPTRVHIRISPSAENDTKGEDWQTGKTVSQANSYMLRYEIASDVTFIVGGSKEEIRAHKYVLMSRSAVLFKSLVRHLGNADVRINVPDVKPTIFRELLQYLYTDEFDIHSDNVTSMLFAAKKFDLQGLSDLCFKYLDAEMNTDNVCRVMEQAHIYNENGLYDKCLRFVSANGNEVIVKPAFGELCPECVEKIIRQNDLNADEDKVYEGCIIWANAECRRQKKQPNDETRRDMLGDLLYLIRFPTMDIAYFTHKVSLGNVLTNDETLSIFQYFHGEVQQLPNRFNKKPRHRIAQKNREPAEPVKISDYRKTPSKERILRVARFSSCNGEWKQNGPPDAISFSVSRTIILYGVQIYGTARGQEMYTVKLFIYDDLKEEVRKTDATIYTNSSKQKYDVYLSEPVRVPPRRNFTAVVLMKGGPTRKGADGEAVRIEEGVTFDFSASNKSSNGTDVNVGQIPGLLFTVSQ